jgi:hypothetical protein
MMERAGLVTEAVMYRVALAEAELESGHRVQAAQLLVEHLPTVAEEGDNTDVVYALDVAAQALAAFDQLELASLLSETCEQLMNDSGAVRAPWERERFERNREHYRSELSDDRALTTEPRSYHPAECLQRAREALRHLAVPRPE